MLLLLVVFIFSFFIQPCWSISPDWKLVVKVNGTVESQKADSTKWVGIWQSRMLKDGDKARTLDNSRANIRLADQTVVQVGSNTVVEISKFQLTEKSRLAELKLTAGKVRVNVGKFGGKESKVQVTTPNAVLAARGTDFYVEQEKVTKQGPGGNTNIIVFSGTVNVTSGGGNFMVFAGNTCTITSGGMILPNLNSFPSGGGGIFGGGGQGGDADLSSAGGPPPNQPPPAGNIISNFGGTPGGNMPPPGGGTGPGNVIVNPTQNESGSVQVQIQ
ncbi:MAG: FecR family protein [Firmicutes bacterium]|nr:FecR family protein [Bacillota bacterium]